VGDANLEAVLTALDSADLSCRLMVLYDLDGKLQQLNFYFPALFSLVHCTGMQRLESHLAAQAPSTVCVTHSLAHNSSHPMSCSPATLQLVE
jgi:hypothetical protein